VTLNPKRTAMTVFGNSRKLVSDLSLYSLVNAGIKVGGLDITLEHRRRTDTKSSGIPYST
jgi:hypothetical protein